MKETFSPRRKSARVGLGVLAAVAGIGSGFVPSGDGGSADRQKAEAAAQQERERDNLRREDARRREAAFAAEQQKTKPPCTDVIVSGFIASSVMEVEALHAAHLSPEDLEDVLARHPYSCQINSFGVAFGCRGGAQVHGRRATVKNWTATHYVIEIPLDFQMGRRDAPAWVRRSEARCRR